MNIFQKMSAITAELQTVAKNLTVGTGNNKYKAVSERDVLDAVKPIETKYGVYSYPVKRTVLESNLLESESTNNGQTTKKTTFMTRIETVYRFVNIENPDEYIETTTFAEGIDPQDKGSGKAMTYADKYALMKAYKISTGDDPDQTVSEETRYTRQTPAQPTDYRRMLLVEMKRRNINYEEFAVEHGMSKNTTPEEFKRLYEFVIGANEGA